MIRFRSVEDERRYTTLRAEMFAALAHAGVPAERIAMIMRNVGKVEMSVYLEGMRQGLALAALSEAAADGGDPAAPPVLPDPYSFKAYQLHALVYGSADTPLRAMEKQWLARLGVPEDHLAASWLDDKPLRFAPMTMAEWLGQEPPTAPIHKIRSSFKPYPVGKVALGQDGSAVDPSTSPSGAVDFGLRDNAKMGDLGPFTAEAEELLRQLEAEPDLDRLLPVLDAAARGDDAAFARAVARTPVPMEVDAGDEQLDAALKEIASSDRDPVAIMRERGLLTEKASAEEEDADRPESPDFLDTVRSEIVAMRRGGWEPGSWQDLILDLHRHMKVDAAFLDLQLSTPVGRTVLDQCGLPGMAPGAGIDLAELLK